MPEQVQTPDEIREVVRERYAKAAREVLRHGSGRVWLRTVRRQLVLWLGHPGE